VPRNLIGDGDTFETEGLRFRVTHVRDEDMREPWKEHDGHGVISDWTDRGKSPGERILVSDRSQHRYYDIQESIKIALRDGWGVEHPEGKTKRQIAAEAVEEDFRRMKAWCDDEWWWVGVVVALLDTDGNPIGRPECRESLWGIEGDSGAEYFDEVARELAGEIAARFKDKAEVCIPIRKP
jgi:hypothetical protein